MSPAGKDDAAGEGRNYVIPGVKGCAPGEGRFVEKTGGKGEILEGNIVS